MATKGTIEDFVSALILVLTINFGIFFLGFSLSLPVNTNWTIIFNPLLLIGLGQWLYIIPWVRYLTANNELEKRKGVITGGIITLLLNGACFGPTIIQQIFH
jgi:hypothetical protein